MKIAVIRRFSKAIGRLPLAGRAAIRPALSRLYASSPGKDRALATRRASALLLTFSLLHGWQATFGLDLARSPTHGFAPRTIGATYFAVNCLVALHQANLLARVARFSAKRGNRQGMGLSEFSAMDYLQMTAITLGGQLAFLWAAR